MSSWVWTEIEGQAPAGGGGGGKASRNAVYRTWILLGSLAPISPTISNHLNLFLATTSEKTLLKCIFFYTYFYSSKSCNAHALCPIKTPRHACSPPSPPPALRYYFNPVPTVLTMTLWRQYWTRNSKARFSNVYTGNRGLWCVFRGLIKYFSSS
jgi:hypothetical protein